MANNIPQDVLNELMKAELDKRRAEEEKKAYDQRIDATVKILSACYDKAAAYTNLIIIAGYAGMFTLWNTVKANLSPREMMSTAFLFAFSILVFVLWEVASMVYNAKDLAMFNNALRVPQKDFDTAIQAAYRNQERRSVRLRRFWVAAILFTVLPAVTGGAILFGSFIRQLLVGT